MRTLRNPFGRQLPLLLLLTALFTFLIQSGELGTADTLHRLEVAHSLWTGQPQVLPWEYPEFGLHGRNGHIYAWYGIGQSLLLLPADLIATAATHLPLWADYVDSQADPAIRSILVSITINILVNVWTALAAFRFLELLGFTTREAVAGTLSLLLATTHLHYAQNMQENNYICLLALVGFLLQSRWLQTGSRRALFWGSMALGLNLLTRITTALDLMAVGCFLLLTAFFARRDSTGANARPDQAGWINASRNLERSASQQLRATSLQNEAAEPSPSGNLPGDFRPDSRIQAATGVSIADYLRTALPVYAAFFFLDRLYQFLRFGSWTNTYVSIFAREERQIDPSLPLKYPFSGHFFAGGLDSGMIGPWLNPSKSILLFDPLFALSLLVTILLWHRLGPAIRAFLVTALLLIFAYLTFYARYFSWPGDFAWGDRYVSTAVELSTLLTWPLLLRFWSSISRAVRLTALAVTGISVVIQGASLAFWVPLEIYQEEALAPHTWVILLRFKNIAALAFGQDKTAAWGMNAPSRFPAMFQDPWDTPHITTWNFLPSLLRHIGVAPLWAVHILYVVWGALGLCMLLVATKLIRALKGPQSSLLNT